MKLPELRRYAAFLTQGRSMTINWDDVGGSVARSYLHMGNCNVSQPKLGTDDQHTETGFLSGLKLHLGGQ